MKNNNLALLILICCFLMIIASSIFIVALDTDLFQKVVFILVIFLSSIQIPYFFKEATNEC